MYIVYTPQGRSEEERVRDENRYLREQLQRIQEGEVTAIRTIVGLHGDKAIVANPMVPLEVKLPKHVAEKIKPGQSIRVHAQNGAFLSPSEYTPPGDVATVTRVIDDKRCEIATQISTRAVACAITVEAGDRVSLDSSGSVVTANLGKVATGFAGPADDSFDWDQIIGCDDAKRELREAIEGPVTHGELHAKFGKRPTRGILLYGPPGTGKTLLARAAASALRRLHGANGAMGFIAVKGPEILGKYVGQSEGAVRELFARARTHHREHGFPAVLFLDEADAILAARGTGRSSDMERTIVPQFLTEMDGIEASGAVVIIATNRVSALDPAIREGRIDLRIRVGRPTQSDVAKIVALNLRGKPCDPDSLGAIAAEELFDERHVVRSVETTAGPVDVPLSVLASGALAAAAAERAVALALRRAVGGGEIGIVPADVRTAVRELLASNRDVALSEDVTEWVLARAKERAAESVLASKVKRGRS